MTREKRSVCKERPEKPELKFGPVQIFTHCPVGQNAKMSSSHFVVHTTVLGILKTQLSSYPVLFCISCREVNDVKFVGLRGVMGDQSLIVETKLM